MAGLFITVEGIDGAGKTTHLAWLGEYFEQRQRSVVLTREPGGTRLGEALRALLLDAPDPIDPETEALLMFAARREHLERVIRPALSADKVVVCDRFTDATFAYQGSGSGVSAVRLAVLEEWVQRGLQPDLTLFFDVPVEVGRARLQRGQPLDRFEREKEDFFQRVRGGYLERATRFPGRIRIIDATSTVSEVRKELEIILSSC
jgi:dTMP kinase